MLKSLLGKIKSQKSSALSSQHSHQITQTGIKATASKKQQTSYQQLKEDILITSQIHKIRYVAFESYPNLYTKILACPISTFNLLPYAKRKVKEIDLKKDALPEYITPLMQIISKELPNFNHLLINVYPPGVGIMPHFDGPLYRSKVVVLSLGGPSIISFTDSYKNTKKVAKLLLEDQSLHIFEEEAYEKYLHGIQNFTVDSVFINVEPHLQDEEVTINRSSVANFHLTRLYKILTQKLKEIGHVSQFEELDLSKEMDTNCFLIHIKENNEYNYKIQITRRERISITIREKHLQPLETI